jgi:ketosteroid isomerase-like protein
LCLGNCEIQEIQISGDWAFMWSRLTVVSNAWNGHESNTRSGHTLTVFHRQEGRWLLARDANLLGPPRNEG